MIISVITIISTNTYTAQAYKYCDEQLAPADTECQIEQDRDIQVIKSNQSYRYVQINAVNEVVPLKYQEKMLFDSDYYDRVRYCILSKGGKACYVDKLYKGKGLDEDQKEALPALIALLSIPLLFLILILVNTFSGKITRYKKKG